MTPATYNMPNHYKGDTFEAITFTIKENGVVVDLTGTTIRIDFKKDAINSHEKTSKTLGNGITLTDAVNGAVSIDSFVNNWDVGKYIYDAEITFPDGTINTYFKGTLTVIQDVTTSD
jgi:leucyl aminopeptidase (aminopeptidase T)